MQNKFYNLPATEENIYFTVTVTYSPRLDDLTYRENLSFYGVTSIELQFDSLYIYHESFVGSTIGVISLSHYPVISSLTFAHPDTPYLTEGGDPDGD